MRNVYLDYSATTPVKEEVLQEMIPYFTEKFGNPSSLYDKGLESKEAIDTARARIGKLINADPKEIFFTAGGTEADNWAVFGTADKLKEKGNHIITTKIEHHAMLHSCEFLEKQGYEVTYLGIGPDGRISLEELEAAITDK
ncbi:MAG: aminotransferase class V-fold PLP-dependent enzyme, partial [Firmicutes bacterium]|nr:aminotransferase class V-fold PLP-dependent enzyme [Bacillota bacterium]